MKLNEIEKAIKHLENKINKEHIINERDLSHLDNLQQLYISELKKKAQKKIYLQTKKRRHNEM
jgi:ribosomal protein S21